MKGNPTFRTILQYLRPYWGLMILSLFLALCAVGLTLLIPILIGSVLDCIVGVGAVDFTQILRYFVLIGVSVVLTAIFQWIMGTVNNRICYHVVRDIRNEAFEKIQTLPLSYIDSHPYGEIVSRMISDADQFADGLLMGFAQLFTGVMTILGTLIFLLTLNGWITLLVVCLTPLSLIIANFIAKRSHNMFRKQSQTRGEQTALIEEMIGGQKVVRAFGYEDDAMARFDAINVRLESCSRQATFFSSLPNPSTRFVNSVIYAGVGLTGALAVISGHLTVGGLTSCLSYTNQYTKPFNEISGVLTELQNSFACAARLFELIHEPSQVPDADPSEDPPVCGEVRLDDVSFSYVADRKLIEHLSVAAKAGQRVAIVGPTGCGKTTLINLLMRFYDVTNGSVSVDGADVRKMKRHTLRRRYGMVLQETWLKTGTVRENLCMGKPDATEEEMIAAAKAAHAHSFIKRLPKGYDTMLQEDGDGLSQGQKQLLCIARVMLCLPPMLILDEATSSIDTRTEIKIQQAFAEMMRGRTSFIVAHRLSTVREADMILVMKDGHILEQGTHDELLNRNGFYSELYRSQFAH